MSDKGRVREKRETGEIEKRVKQEKVSGEGESEESKGGRERESGGRENDRVKRERERGSVKDEGLGVADL